MAKPVLPDQYAYVVDFLISLRQEKRLLQSDLAQRLGRSQQYVSRVETRLRRLDVVEFYEYVVALGADPEDAILTIFRSLAKA